MLECIGHPPCGDGGGSGGGGGGGGLMAAGAGATAALPLGWAALEAALHALSAAAKPLGLSDSAEVAAVMARLPSVAEASAALMARGGGEANPYPNPP